MEVSAIARNAASTQQILSAIDCTATGGQGKVSMSDLDTEILELKTEGKSLWEIASVLGISHEGVRKKLKNLANREQLSTKAREHELTPFADRGVVSTNSNAYLSRLSEESEVTVNPNTPSHTLTEGVNPLGTPSDKHPGCMNGVFQEVVSEVDSLAEEIKQFLESNGIEVYRMNVEPEGYYVKNNGQVIRFYVSHRDKGDMKR